MYIIDKNHDFYDHYSHIYGVDKSIVLDRRRSTIVDANMLITAAVEPRYYAKHERNGYILLEIGDVQYLVEITNIEYTSDLAANVKSYDVRLIHTYEEHRHLFNSLISIRHANARYGFHFFWKRRKDEDREIEIPPLDEYVRYQDRYVIDLPILAKTKLTSILDADKIWKELQNYISSLNNDVDVSIPMTDVEKASTHGFDKHSFRHPIK